MHGLLTAVKHPVNSYGEIGNLMLVLPRAEDIRISFIKSPCNVVINIEGRASKSFPVRYHVGCYDR
jgi:hypothetical protein